MNSIELELAPKISRVLRLARKKRGVTQFEVAKVVGISQSKVNRFESSKGMPSMAEMVALSEYLDFPLLAATRGFIDRGNRVTLKAQYEGNFSVPKQYRFQTGTSVRLIQSFIQFFERRVGKAKLSGFIERSGFDLDFFSDYDHQINAQFTVDFIENLISCGEISSKTLRNLSEYQFKVAAPKSRLDRSTRIPQLEMAANSLISRLDVLECNRSYSIESISKNYIDFRIALRDHIREIRTSVQARQALCLHCNEALKLVFQRALGFSKNLSAVEVCCVFRGDSKCIHRVFV